MKRIGIMTSGGDGPGMNPAIRAAVRCAIRNNWEVVGIYGGYRGIMDGAFETLQWHDVARIIHRGGTILGTGRYKDFQNNPEVRKKAFENLQEQGIEGLIVIGGDGSLWGALTLWEEFGLPVVGIPGTIDNDIWGTDYSLGSDTALNQGIKAMDALRDTAESHKRVFVMEMFGNKSGYLTTYCGLAAGAAALLVPEKEIPSGGLEKLAADIRKWFIESSDETKRPPEQGHMGKATGPKRKIHQNFRNAIVLLAEGVTVPDMDDKKDDNLRKIRKVHKLLAGTLDEVEGECRTSVLGHIQRGGNPSAFDRNLGNRLGAWAVRALEQGETNCMVGMIKGRLVCTPLREVLEKTKALQDHPRDNAPLLEIIRLQEKLSQLQKPSPDNLNGKKLLVLTSADAPGINLGIRAVVRLARQKGWTCVGAPDDFSSLTGDHAPVLRPLDWEDVHISEMLQGGNLLGTRRLRDLNDDQIARFWKSVRTGNIDGIVVFGGIHALRICQKLNRSEERRPLVFIPTTISNNIPGTDMCIGSDTALNNLVTVMDKCKDPGMALQHIHIIQTSGRKSGWLAINAGLASGATAALTKETHVNKAKLKDIATYIREALNRPGEEAERTGIILLNERVAEQDFSAQTIRDIMDYETDHQTRIIDPGQMQRGGPPSAFDRILCCHFGNQAVEELDRLAANGESDARLVGIMDGIVTANSIDRLLQHPDLDEDGIFYAHAKADEELLERLARRPDRQVSEP